jgi:hypothetical protein
MCGKSGSGPSAYTPCKARDDDLIVYAQQLEQPAAEASAHAERLSAEVQEQRIKRGGANIVSR